jgi:hypothetical protein
MENWKENWRPLIAITYVAISLFDFIIAPIGHIILSHYFNIPYKQWNPLTLEAGGFFHISFGAILGAGSYTKGLAEVENIKNQPDFSTCGEQIVQNQTQTGNIDIQNYKRGIPRG